MSPDITLTLNKKIEMIFLKNTALTSALAPVYIAVNRNRHRVYIDVNRMPQLELLMSVITYFRIDF